MSQKSDRELELGATWGTQGGEADGEVGEGKRQKWEEEMRRGRGREATRSSSLAERGLQAEGGPGAADEERGWCEKGRCMRIPCVG